MVPQHRAGAARGSIRTQPPTRCLAMRVEDDGPGIAPADRERVLARGARADEHAPGHGLGLAMVADTVALYRGELVIGESPALRGACAGAGAAGAGAGSTPC